MVDAAVEEIIAMLNAADAGELDVFVEGETWEDATIDTAHTVTFRLSNGWCIIVFNDEGAWSHIDFVFPPNIDGAIVLDDDIRFWMPEHLERWTSAINPPHQIGDIKFNCDVHGVSEWVGDVWCLNCKTVYVCSGSRLGEDGKRHSIYPAAPAKGMCTDSCGKRLFGGTAFTARPMCRACAKTVAARQAKEKLS